MEYEFEPMLPEHREPVIDIFNHYVENSFAAYPENKVAYQFFDTLLNMAAGYPTVIAKDEEGRIIGFGMLRSHSPIPTFSQTAEITCFIRPEYTGRKIGGLMFEYLIDGAREKGIASILASISSLNERSITFHKKMGFVECGRFKKVGKKKGRDFDVVWMQKML